MTQGIIQLCIHCSAQCSGKYCSDCNTAEKRRAMDKANEDYFKEKGLPPYVCEKCNPQNDK